MTTIEPTVADRQDTYYATEAEVLQALEALKSQVLAHGAAAAGGQYHWGYTGDLQAILHHLQHPPISLTPR